MGTVVGTWRLHAILVIIVSITLIYTSYAMFSPENIGLVNEEGYIIYNNSIDNDLGYNETDITVDTGNNFISALVGIGDFLTFGDINNSWVRLIFNIVMLLMWITLGYIIYTFFKEWVPFV